MYKRQVKFLRDNSEKFDIDPDKILICGFSAGGHLSASLGTLWNSSYLKSIFGKTEIYRPNGLILSYPVITSGQFRHEGSIESIIGKNPDNAMLELVSLEKQVTPDTPKTFIWHCADDGCVPPENTFDFVKALSLNNVSFECHIFPYGGHGLALSDASTAGYEMCIRDSFRMRRMIGDYTIDSSIAYTIDNCKPVRLFSERRVHSVIRVHCP